MEEKELVQEQESAEVETAVQEEPVEVKAEVVAEKKPAKPAKKTKAEKQAELERQYEGLSDDEKYAKIETDKMLARKQKKKIVTFASLCVAFCLAVCIIILAVVPVSLKPACLDNGFETVQFYNGTIGVEPNGTFVKGSAKYEKFAKLYDQAFSQTYISAMLNGSLGSYEVEEIQESVASVLGATGELVTENKKYVHLKYTEDQVFTNQNGKAYKSSRIHNKYGKVKLTFKSAYLLIQEEEGVEKTEIYFVVNYPEFNDQTLEQTGTKQYLITVTVKADTSLIANAWTELTK